MKRWIHASNAEYAPFTVKRVAMLKDPHTTGYSISMDDDEWILDECFFDPESLGEPMREGYVLYGPYAKGSIQWQWQIDRIRDAIKEFNSVDEAIDYLKQEVV